MEGSTQCMCNLTDEEKAHLVRSRVQLQESVKQLEKENKELKKIVGALGHTLIQIDYDECSK